MNVTKGTGSELMADHAAEKRLERGACTFFYVGGASCYAPEGYDDDP
jgi:hypothetical protein